MLYARYQGMYLNAPDHPAGQAPAPQGGIFAQLPVYAAVIAVAILVALGLSHDSYHVDQAVDRGDSSQTMTSAEPVFDGRGKWRGYVR